MESYFVSADSKFKFRIYFAEYVNEDIKEVLLLVWMIYG